MKPLSILFAVVAAIAVNHFFRDREDSALYSALLSDLLAGAVLVLFAIKYALILSRRKKGGDDR
jgi:hypothetical protein